MASVRRRVPPGSPERDFHIWSDTGHQHDEARIIFLDSEVRWHAPATGTASTPTSRT
jgi:hypothetical protein